MEMSKNIHEPNSPIHEETPDKTRAIRVIKYFFVIFMLSGLIGLSSCAVAVHSPRPQRHGFLFIQKDQSVHREYKQGHSKKEHHDNGRHRGHDKKDK